MNNDNIYDKPKKRKLRNLVTNLQSSDKNIRKRNRISLPCLPEKSSTKTANREKCDSNELSKYTWLMRKALCIGFCYIVYLFFSNKQFLEDLEHLSITQYYFYMHGRQNYCEERSEYGNITKILELQVYGQENAIRNVKRVFDEHVNISEIILYGPSGVGKTLTSNIIQNTFQWPSNVYQVLWSNVESKSTKLKRAAQILPKLSRCAQNAIFIDDAEENDVDVIKEFHENFVKYCETNDLKAFAFYVMRESNKIEKLFQFELGDKIHVVKYRSFNETDLLRCIEIESKRYNIKLGPTEVQEVIENVNVDRSGCKNVAAKISRLN